MRSERGAARFFLHQKPSRRRDAHGMRSIRGSQLEQNILHVCLYGCLRNGKVRSNYLVGRTASYLSKDFDFALTEIILRIMFGEFSRDFLGYIPLSEVNCANRPQQLRPNHVFQDVSSGACLQRAAREDIPFVGSQYDNPGLWMFLPDRRDGINSVHVRHLQVHQCDIRSLAPEHFDGLSTVRSFANDQHVLFTLDYCGNAFAQYRMIVDGKYFDLSRSHHCRPLLNLEGTTFWLSMGFHFFSRVRDRSRHYKLYFRARGLAAPDIQFSPNHTGPFAHAR